MIHRSKIPATLKDVAAAAGVSISCASVILNGTKSGTRVSERTRNTVIQHAEILGYRPNAIGRSLQRRRTQVFGFISMVFTLDAGNEFLADLIGGMQEACRELDHALLLYSLQEDAGVDEWLRKLTDGYVDGLVVFGKVEHPVARALMGAHLPLVAIADPIGNMPCVRVDDWEGGERLAAELAALGYTHALYRLPTRPSISVEDRVTSFIAASSRLGIEVTLGSRVHADTGVDFTPAEQRWLEINGGPRSVVAVWEDHTAIPTVAILRDMGFRVPEDIGVVGFNGNAFGPWVPSLTTIKAPWRKVARESVHMLLRQIEGLPIESTNVLPVHFVSGSTTCRAFDSIHSAPSPSFATQ